MNFSELPLEWPRICYWIHEIMESSEKFKAFLSILWTLRTTNGYEFEISSTAFIMVLIFFCTLIPSPMNVAKIMSKFLDGFVP